MAEAEMKSIASIRLQEKYNCVRAYEAIGARMEDFCKDWTKTKTGARSFLWRQTDRALLSSGVHPAPQENANQKPTNTKQPRLPEACPQTLRQPPTVQKMRNSTRPHL